MKKRKQRAKEYNRRSLHTEPSKKCTEGERKTYEVFLRGEHPDNRSVAQWLKALSRKEKSRLTINSAGNLQFKI